MRRDQNTKTKSLPEKGISNFFTFLTLIVFSILVLTESSQAQPPQQHRIQAWEDLAGYRGSQYATGRSNIFRIFIIKDHQNPCDCDSSHKYKVRSHMLVGNAAWSWLEQRGLSYRSVDNIWMKTDIYKQWEFSRNAGSLYWQKCWEYCKNKTNPGKAIYGLKAHDECIPKGFKGDRYGCSQFVWIWHEKSGRNTECRDKNKVIKYNLTCSKVCLCKDNIYNYKKIKVDGP